MFTSRQLLPAAVAAATALIAASAGAAAAKTHSCPATAGWQRIAVTGSDCAFGSRVARATSTTLDGTVTISVRASSSTRRVRMRCTPHSADSSYGYSCRGGGILVRVFQVD